MKIITGFCIYAIAVFICPAIIAQTKSSPFEVGINLGTGLYHGDLAPTILSPYKSPGLFLGFSGSKKLTNVLAMEAYLAIGKVKADDANYSTPEYRQQRNFNFKTRVIELTVSALFTPLGRERKINPYLVAGAIEFSENKTRLQCIEW